MNLYIFRTYYQKALPITMKTKILWKGICHQRDKKRHVWKKRKIIFDQSSVYSFDEEGVFDLLFNFRNPEYKLEVGEYCQEQYAKTKVGFIYLIDLY